MKKKKKKDLHQLITFLDEDLDNPFKEAQEKRFHYRSGGKTLVRLAVAMVLTLLAVIFLPYDFVHKQVTPARYIESVSSRFSMLWGLVSGDGNREAILFAVCTGLIIILTGGCLAICGSVYQGIYHTPMASPSMMGIQSGGMLAAVAYLYFFGNPEEGEAFFTFDEYNNYLSTLSFYDLYARQIWMIAGSLIGAGIVIFLSTRAGRGKMSTVVLILAGSLFSSFANMFTSLGQYIFTYRDATENRVYALMSISMGNFSNAYQPVHLLMIAVPVLISTFCLYRMSPALNLIMFGDQEAASMGMSINKYRTAAFMLCLVPCAMLLAFCGQIGFVGLLVPHFARQMVGSDYRLLIPASLMLGGTVLLLVYGAAICTGLTMSINLVSSVVGGILTLLFILRYRRERNADWA